MICLKCKKEIPDETTICPFCNEEIELSQQPDAIDETKSEDNAFDNKLSDEELKGSIDDSEANLNIEKNDNADENKSDNLENNNDGEQVVESKVKKPFNKKMFLIVGCIVLMIVSAFAVIHYVNENRYNQGIELLENNDYQEAYTIFKSLGSFNDAKEKSEYAFQGIKYQEGKQLMNEGNYADAITIFADIAKFKDANNLLGECLSLNNYHKALALMESEDYQGALELLKKVKSEYVSNVNEVIFECENTIKYLDAISAYENGENYEAYKMFISLGDFKDSALKAEECIVPKPNTGVIYQNDNYRGSACSLTIKPPSDGSSTYFKIYNETGETLVANIFINSGNSAKINLPAGKYTFKSAYGYKVWFGEEDMFGDEGVYQQIKVSNSNEIFTLERNYDYTLTLRSVSKGGTTVPTQNIDKDSF